MSSMSLVAAFTGVKLSTQSLMSTMEYVVVVKKRAILMFCSSSSGLS